MFQKTKSDEMLRLRAAGFSLAHAERLSRDKRGPGLVIAGVAAVALVLVGGIVTLGSGMTRTAQTVSEPQMPAAAVLLADTQAQQPDALGAATLRALQQHRLSQSLAMEEQAEAPPAEQITRTASGISARLTEETEAEPMQDATLLPPD
jgi:hypothetical protein